jgi:hypothetical protein
MKNSKAGNKAMAKSIKKREARIYMRIRTLRKRPMPGSGRSSDNAQL